MATKIELSLEPDFEPYVGPKVPASVEVDFDYNSSFRPTAFMWLAFTVGDSESWVKLTLEEAAKLRDALTHELEVHDEFMRQEED